MSDTEEIGKWMKIANQNALEREEWADRYRELEAQAQASLAAARALALEEALIKIPAICSCDWDSTGIHAGTCLMKCREKIAAIAPSNSTAMAKLRHIQIPDGLHEDTEKLVLDFASAIAEKLFAAQEKYGYSNEWKRDDWMDECRSHLLDHIRKGDPRDVANYCMFLWHHKESTNPALAKLPHIHATFTDGGKLQPLSYDFSDKQQWPNGLDALPSLRKDYSETKCGLRRKSRCCLHLRDDPRSRTEGGKMNEKMIVFLCILLVLFLLEPGRI